jgi:hypothetical protein
VKMLIFVSSGIWGFGVQSVRCLFLVTYFALQRQIPSACIGVSNVLYVGLIFQRHEIYFTCFFFLRCKHVSATAVCPAVTSPRHMLMNCWITTLTSSPLHFPSLFPHLTRTFATTTIIHPLPSNNQTQSKNQNNTNPPRKKPNPLTPQNVINQPHRQ